MSHRPAFIAYLLTSILSACAHSDGGAEQALVSSSLDAESAAESILLEALTFNSAVSSAFDRAKADLEEEPFVLLDEIQRSLQSHLRDDHILDLAAEEILDQMQMTEEDELTGRVYAIVKRFPELIIAPHDAISMRRLGNFLDDSLERRASLRSIVNDDSADRKKTAYYLAPAYNVVASTHVFALAAAGYPRSTMEDTYRDAIEVNQHLVGTGDADDPGYLSDWVASQTAGSGSAREKIDKDPIIYSIRRSLEEQQRALE